MPLSLDQIKIGTKGIVLDVSPSHIRTKLLELGFVSGSEIEVVFRAPLNDPIAVELNGFLISLRLEEASTIFIEDELLS
jgi:ferrous iron transport protein A